MRYRNHLRQDFTRTKSLRLHHFSANRAGQDFSTKWPMPARRNAWPPASFSLMSVGSRGSSVSRQADPGRDGTRRGACVAEHMILGAQSSVATIIPTRRSSKSVRCRLGPKGASVSTKHPRQVQASNVGLLAEILVVLGVASFTLVNRFDVPDKLDRLNPFDHLKAELILNS